VASSCTVHNWNKSSTTESTTADDELDWPIGNEPMNSNRFHLFHITNIKQVYFTQNYQISGLYPSNGILKHNISGTGCFRTQVRASEERMTVILLGLLKRPNPNHWAIYII
jgi:hypothetical protein